MAMATATLMDHQEQTQKDDAEIRAVIERLHQAHHDKDVQAIAASYAQDAAIFNLAPPLRHTGINLQEKQAWLDSWNGPIEIKPSDLSITISGDVAFCHCYLRMIGQPKSAPQRVDFWMRETLCMSREAGSWRIVHEHTSVPFYMDGSLRPAFDLKP
jgi:ketosteroid isomerase-like protein